jgi:hypothetical protein
MADDATTKREDSTLHETDGVAPAPVSEKDKVADAEAGLSGAAPKPPAFTVPDGGLEAWLVVLGGWLILFSTFGYINGAWPACRRSGWTLTAYSVRRV